MAWVYPHVCQWKCGCNGIGLSPCVSMKVWVQWHRSIPICVNVSVGAMTWVDPHVRQWKCGCNGMGLSPCASMEVWLQWHGSIPMCVNGSVGAMAWVYPHVRQWKSVVLHWAMLWGMPESRVDKLIPLWAKSKSNASCKYWFNLVRQKLTNLDLHNYCDILNNVAKYSLVNTAHEILMYMIVSKWVETIH